MIICAYFLLKKPKKTKLKTKIFMLLIMGIFIYGIIYLTNDRASYIVKDMNLGQRLYMTVYEYFAGSVTYFEKVLYTYPKIVASTYGLNFIEGFISPIFVLLNYIHVLDYPEIFNTIGLYVCNQLMIGPNTYYNAMPTIFAYFYIDGGLISTFLESFIFGYISKRIYERANKKELMFVAFYCLIFIQICNASTRWFFYSPDYSLAYIYLYLIINKSKSTTLLKKGV